MTSKINFRGNTLVAIILVTISFTILVSSVIGNSDARKMGPYSCKPNNDGSIGTTKCCAIDEETMLNWCTTCDNTNPPSNCSEAKQVKFTTGDERFNRLDETTHTDLQPTNPNLNSKNDIIIGEKSVEKEVPIQSSNVENRGGADLTDLNTQNNIIGAEQTD